MFVQSEKFVEAHGGKLGDISIYGQESNPTTRRLAVMNLALRGIEADFGPEHADTFRRDLHPDLRADYVLANPPFNDSDWFRKDDDVRWQYGVPPRGNANFAWVQHFIHHLAPHGMAGFVLARFCFWVKHGCRKIGSREETGHALARVQRSVWIAPNDFPRFEIAMSIGPGEQLEFPR
jgi:type I restriction-modification system DNA methylase subunit